MGKEKEQVGSGEVSEQWAASASDEEKAQAEKIANPNLVEREDEK